MKITDRVSNAWNAFFNKDPTSEYRKITYGAHISSDPYRRPYTNYNGRTIVTPIATRIAMDVATIKFIHAEVDEDDHYLKTLDTDLNRCLWLSANWDQTGRELIQDFVETMFEVGHAVIVPTHVDIDPRDKESYKILELRVGKVTEWYPAHVKVEVYNEEKMQREEVLMTKNSVAIVKNPFFSIVNEPNSKLQRLMRKQALLDQIDERQGSGKLDLIIQLPFALKGALRKAQAEEREAEIDDQLANSKHGIAYLDSTEHVTQLNRPIENNLLEEIKDITTDIFNQLGLTDTILNGTADEKTMLNYYNRTIEPICAALCDEMTRKFISTTGIAQHKRIKFFRDAFRLVPVADLAELGDKFTRNEIMTSNEFRQIVGMKPSNDPKADMLNNANIASSNNEMKPMPPEGYEQLPMEENQNG